MRAGRKENKGQERKKGKESRTEGKNEERKEMLI